MLGWVLGDRIYLSSRALFGCAWILLAGASGCSSDPKGPLCSSIAGDSEGLQVTGCAGGTITLSAVTYDATGAKASYSFVVSCNDRSAHGVWSRTAGVECVDGAYPCDGGTCTPTSNIDCRVLTNCLELGECGYVEGKCVLTDEGCANSEILCGLSGACHLVSGACAATSDTDCRTPFGACQGCAFKGPCATTGNCVQKEGVCIAAQDADCKKAQQCSFAGKCSLEGEACIAKIDADCTGSEVCRTAGQCAAVAGACAVR
jgi:hypothetical protein